MKNELNQKLKLDSISWVKVIEGLEGKTTFNSHDIKRALRKTGRSFNNNGPFHAVVKNFIAALGNTVTSTMSDGEIIYKISSTEDAIKAVDKRKTINKTRKVGIGICAATVGGASMGIGYIKSHKPKTTVETTTKTISDEDKIKGLFKRSYAALEHALYLLAVYVKHGETKLCGQIIKTELTDLGVNYNTFITSTKPILLKVFENLDFNPLVIRKYYKTSEWKLEGPKDLLDEYTHLCEVYEKLTGKKFKNLDDYITTSTSKSEVEKRFEILKEIEENRKKTPRVPRTEKNPETMWKKWLLVLASKNALGASRSISSLVSWVRTDRHYEIDEEEAKKLYRELMEDSENELRYQLSEHISMSEKAWKILSKFYSPTQFKEKIFIKLFLSPEVVSTAFTGLNFKLDDTTTSGMYLYTVELNRSLTCELALKKLLRFIRISGKIYTDNSWMVKRVSDIISKEDSNEKSKNIPLLAIEEKI